jgi:hypothetical protein
MKKGKIVKRIDNFEGENKIEIKFKLQTKEKQMDRQTNK